MQPCSREMQGINSLLNSSQISLQELHHHHSQNQIQNSHMNHHNIHHHLNPHFDPTSHDDFLKHMLSNLPPPPSSSWSDPNPKSFWDLNPCPSSLNIDAADVKPRDLSDDAPPSNAENVAFPYDEHANLASKFRNHQISGVSPTSRTTAAALMLQQQLLMCRGVSGGGDSGLLQMPLSLDGGGDFERSRNDVVDGSSFKSPNPAGENSVQALFNGFAGSLHSPVQASNQTQHFQSPPPGQSFGASGGGTNQAPAGGTQGQPRQRVRARRGQATDPHSIAERLRRERIAERMKALQELVPNANKTDKASMLDEIIDYVKFLQLQVKVLSMSRLGGATAVAPLVADMSSEGGGNCIQGNDNGGALPRNQTTTAAASSSNVNESLSMTEQQVAKLMEEDMGSAMQYLQGKGLCLMPISLATAISAATCHTRNPLIINQIQSNHPNPNPVNVIASNTNTNSEGSSSPGGLSVLTVQSANGGVDSAVKDAASVSKP